MSDNLPAPPTPADADLRGMPYMPFKGDRAFASETWISASPEGRCAALRLWWHSFAKEVPAGSLPDNDRLLADYAGYGVAVKAWLKVKREAMRGWFKCSDGRLYHNVVAEVVAEAWQERSKHRGEKEKWREKKRRQRERNDAVSPSASQGTNDDVSEKSPGKSLLREEKGREETSSLREDDTAPAERRASVRDELLRVLDAEHADAVIEHRKAKRAKLTPRAAKLIADELAKCPDPNAAADEMIAAGWQGFKAKWLENRNQSQVRAGNEQAQSSSASRGRDVAAAALEAGERLDRDAELRQRPGVHRD